MFAGMSTHAYHPKIFVALDTPSVDDALFLANQLAHLPVGLKIGLEFLHANGGEGINKIVETGLPVFFDCKLHDIPKTVGGGIRSLTGMAPYMVNVHASGGLAMMQAAKEAAEVTARQFNVPAPLVIAVTVLTSLDDDDMQSVGQGFSVQDQVVRLAELSKKAGLDGVVCSGSDIENIRNACGDNFKLIVPGIRPVGGNKGDQKRVMTPADALSAGADYLVMGRPVAQAEDPAGVIESVLRTCG